MADLAVAQKARLSARAALDKRAQALQLLDLAALSGIADYFVLCTGSSTTHVETIAAAVEAALKAEGHRALHREGAAASGWMLLDYGDVVVHIFLPETRAFYALDRLWGDAPELPIEA
jgi:ribosome-associated protein